MKRYIFVVEGQTEQIFLEKFIEKIVGGLAYHIELSKYHSSRIIKIGTRGFPENNATNHIQIINVEGDDSVLSFISDNILQFVKKNAVGVFGLRDRFTGDKKKKPVNSELIDQFTKTLEKEHNIKIEVTVAVEEIEAWFLAVPCFFNKFHNQLTIQQVSTILGVDISTFDVELIAHPSSEIDKVLKTIGLKYNKKLNLTQSITDKLNYDDLYFKETISALKRTIDHINLSITL